ncbi:MAG: hypothetical protein DHS20C21_15880 [Gemmatimonadota bacterium]|nr:MAG: hypothetical protein DHS20C21_15880 [Gemmatimonadota bacterium]
MNSDLERSPLECIDASVGDRLAELERPDLDAASRSLIEAHVSACDACREIVELDRRVGGLARAGRLPQPVTTTGSWPKKVIPMAVLAWAASLAGLVLLPPRPVGDPSAVRGEGELRFVRPVEGEVLPGGDLQLRWTELTGAAEYVVEVRDSAGEVAWQGTSPVPEVKLDAGTLSAPSEYRALLTVRPADLAGPVPASVAFRTASWPGVVADRATRAHRWRQILAGIATAFLLGVGVVARWRPPARPC